MGIKKSAYDRSQDNRNLLIMKIITTVIVAIVTNEHCEKLDQRFMTLA